MHRIAHRRPVRKQLHRRWHDRLVYSMVRSCTRRPHCLLSLSLGRLPLLHDRRHRRCPQRSLRLHHIRRHRLRCCSLRPISPRPLHHRRRQVANDVVICSPPPLALPFHEHSKNSVVVTHAIFVGRVEAEKSSDRYMGNVRRQAASLTRGST